MKRRNDGRILALIPALAVAIGCTGAPDEQREHADRMAVEHAHDAPIANPASQTAPAVDVEADEVQYATVDGRAVIGYLARPAGVEGALPALIVIHEWWGLNDNIRAMTRRLAGEGFAALAVDLYSGQVADERDGAYALMTSANANPAAAEANLGQAYAYLTEELDAPNVASIGWCFGGGWSLNTALLLPDRLDAAVIYYGHLVTDPERLAALQMPILGLFGELDQGIPLEDVRAFERALADLGKDAKIIVYPGADHAFANPSGRNYQPETAAQAWRETVAFLDAELRPSG
jgi:carboxymethylenebutenolidase